MSEPQWDECAWWICSPHRDVHPTTPSYFLAHVNPTQPQPSRFPSARTFAAYSSISFLFWTPVTHLLSAPLLKLWSVYCMPLFIFMCGCPFFSIINPLKGKVHHPTSLYIYYSTLHRVNAQQMTDNRACSVVLTSLSKPCHIWLNLDREIKELRSEPNPSSLFFKNTSV